MYKTRTKSHRIIGRVAGVMAVVTITVSAVLAVHSWFAPEPLITAPDLKPAVPERPSGADDGVLPDGVTIADNDYPGIINLNPELLQALRQAATKAANDGIVFYVTSGWRSPSYQNQLLREAIAEYGSAAEAARWVATAETSAHVSGDAIDLGGQDAITWLSKNGATYGLCQTYRNEPWHYELRPKAATSTCPRKYIDPTHDPRIQ